MERFDGFYTEIAKETGSMEKFLESFMSFLVRRTDFFYEADPGDKMGFPPGVCENMIAAIFKKYQNEHYKKYPKKSIEDFNKKVESLKSQKKESEPKISEKEGQVKTETDKLDKQPLETGKITEKQIIDTKINKTLKTVIPEQPKLEEESKLKNNATDIRQINQHFQRRGDPFI